MVEYRLTFATVVGRSQKIEWLDSNQSTFLVFVSSGYYALESG